jgi:hypothetical protein
MSRDLLNEIDAIRQKLQVGLEMAKPTEQVKAVMILSVINLHVFVDHIKNSPSPEERRRLVNEYERQKESIEKGIQMLIQKTQRFRKLHACPQH